MTTTQTRNGAAQPRSGVAQRARAGPASSTSETANTHRAGSTARLLSGGGAMSSLGGETVDLPRGNSNSSAAIAQRSALFSVCFHGRTRDRAFVHLGLGGD